MSAPRQPQKVLKRPRNSSPSAHLGEGAPLNGLSHRCVSVGKMEVVKLNQMAISRVDPQAREIVSTVPGVVLYEYDESTATWVSGWGSAAVGTRRGGVSGRGRGWS